MTVGKILRDMVGGPMQARYTCSFILPAQVANHSAEFAELVIS